MKKIRIRRLDDHADEKNDHLLIRPFVNNSKRTFNQFYEHSIPISPRSTNTTNQLEKEFNKKQSSN